MNNDLVTLIANLSLTLSFIVAVIFGIAQVKAAGKDRRDRLTLETLRNFQTREFAELIHHVVASKIPATWKEWQGYPEEDRIRFIQFSQQMESLGMLVAEGFISIDPVDKTLGSFVTTAWEKYKAVFLDMREKQPDPFLGEYFQWMAEQIDKRMNENPRKPFFQTSKKAA